MLTISDAVRALDSELHNLFGNRLKSLVAYAPLGSTASPASTLAVLDRLTADDLRACAARVEAWQDAGLSTPLLLAEDEFARSLDAFPFEFGGIMANHALVSGSDPFNGLSVDPADLRHACEIQARSHLLHLREGFLETGGRSDLLAELIARSSGALAALVRSVSRLQNGPSDALEAAAGHVENTNGLDSGSLGQVTAYADGRPLSSDAARHIFPVYLDAVGRLVNSIDRWVVSDQ